LVPCVTVTVAVNTTVAVAVGGIWVEVAVGGAPVAVEVGGALVAVALDTAVAVAVAIVSDVAVAVGACERVAVGVALGRLLLSPPQAEKSGNPATRSRIA